ncbi:hypothetical protein HYH02_013557 [Chlamydomonas schloesseri]|uniref:Uncharacterized protein n=1 Tax=Chlamydomonas schloesseri TaxID=2026947 RepID=A0A835T2K7_9CHLO|nr:hypothetical protein HYH02_013557 [Chlamydomonas schloesseri]|eukprot:KAG2430715.1 hypothetical protein HYH02_013557 [Chlamydomonas schloesseri]
MSTAGGKVHSSAVAVVPPAAVWRRIQTLRVFADKSFVRWPPHINLLYPFYPDGFQKSELSGGPEGDESDGGGAGRGRGGRGGGNGRRAGSGRASRTAANAGASLMANSGALGDAGSLAAAQLQQVQASAGAGGLVTDPFGQLATRAGRALARVEPFTVRLERLRVFRHSARSITVWADPVAVPQPHPAADAATTAHTAAVDATACDAGAGPAAAVGGLVAVQALLEAEFPDCTDLSADEGRGIRGFVPHLSLGQLRDERELEALQAAWEPLEWTVDSVQLISRRGYLSPFTLRYHVPFGLGPGGLGASPGLDPAAVARRVAGHGTGGGRVAAVRRLDVPYVATMANHLQPLRPSEPQRLQPMPQPQPQQPVDEEQAADMDDVRSLVARFASPCLVAPPSPHPQPTAPGRRQDHAAVSAMLPAPFSTAAAADLDAELGSGGGGAAIPQSGDIEGVAATTGAAGVEGPSVWWFAYGGALQASPRELGAIESRPAVLAGGSYRLAFNRPGGRANLVPAEAAAVASGAGTRPRPPQQQQHQAVHGVLHRLPLETMARLLLVLHEACPMEVACVPCGREPAAASAGGAAPAAAGAAPGPQAELVALAFVAPPERCLAHEAPPHPGYLKALLDGCDAYGLERGFRDWLLQSGPPQEGAGTILQAVGATDGTAAVSVADGALDGAGAESLGRGGSLAQRQVREPPRVQNRRTGAKKAAAGLPRGVLIGSWRWGTSRVVTWCVVCEKGM